MGSVKEANAHPKLPAISAFIRNGELRGAVAPLLKTIPPHDRNTYPYHGEGDKGGEVNKTIEKLIGRVEIKPTPLCSPLQFAHHQIYYQGKWEGNLEA